MSSRRGAPLRFQDKHSKHRGRNVIELCKCSKCKAGALPGDEGCHIARWEVEKHRLDDELRAMPMYQRGKPHVGMMPSQRASGSARALPRPAQDDDREARWAGPSKRTRLTDDDGEARGEGSFRRARLTQDDDELELEYLDPPAAPLLSAAPDALLGLYEDPDDPDDDLLQALLEAEGPHPQVEEPHLGADEPVRNIEELRDIELRDTEPRDTEPRDIEPYGIDEHRDIDERRDIDEHRDVEEHRDIDERRDIDEHRDVEEPRDIDEASDATDETLDRGHILRNAIRSARRGGANADGLDAPTESTFSLPLPSALRPPDEVLASSHDLWFVRVVLVLVAFLNTKFHVTFRACALILFALRHIFVTLGLIAPHDTMPETLKTTFKHLQLEDRFHILVACPSCLRLYEPTTPSTSTCSTCETPLFDAPRSSTISGLFRKITQKEPPEPKPKLSVPFQPLSSLLTDMLARPGMEEEVDAWRSRGREDGEYKEIMDGAIWKTLKGADKKIFFDTQDDSELRIGVTLGLDWFSCARGPYAASHASGVFSFCVSNLPPALRYRPKNLLLSMMTPGPTEPTAEQLQHFNALLVNDLIQLWEHGIMIKTPLHPEGRLVRVALLGIVCDHPAMCKMCGFADKSHNEAPCTKCHATSENMYDDEFMTGDHDLRSGSEHKRHAAAWKDIEDKSDRHEYFTEHGVRWSEFARLPYFDLVRMTVVDPMHNLLLGVVKTQWYNRWIQSGALRATTDAGTERELASVHRFLDSLEAPGWIGRLPKRVGEPAGGSLSADEYKSLIITSGAMMLPIVFDIALPGANEDYKKAQRKFDKSKANVPADGASKSKADALPSPRIHEEDPRLALLLATSLKILLGSSVDEQSLQRGEKLLLEYLALYKKVYGVAAMKPNFHFATHTVPQIRDYGPVPGFWAFLGERLNKVLKGINLNNQHGGQLEITMMRGFGRDVHLHDLILYLSTQSEDSASQTITRRMLAESAPPRGTVELSAHEPNVSDDALSEMVLPIALGPTARAPEKLQDSVRAALYKYYNAVSKHVYYPTERRRPQQAPMLNANAQCLKHVLIDGRRVIPVKETKEHFAASSVVKVLIDGKLFAGEVISFFHHQQKGIPESPILFAEMRWMKREMVTPVEGDPWKGFPELEFECWTLNEFHAVNTPGLPSIIILVSAIRCQLARMIDRTSEPPIWLTTSLDRHSITMGEGEY